MPGAAGAGGADAIRLALAAGHLHVLAAAALEPLHSFPGLGAGEIAVIAYAQAHGLVALVDDRKARATALRLAIPVIGSGAVLVRLKRSGHVASVRVVLDQ